MAEYHFIKLLIFFSSFSVSLFQTFRELLMDKKVFQNGKKLIPLKWWNIVRPKMVLVESYKFIVRPVCMLRWLINHYIGMAMHYFLDCIYSYAVFVQKCKRTHQRFCIHGKKAWRVKLLCLIFISIRVAVICRLVVSVAKGRVFPVVARDVVL